MSDEITTIIRIEKPCSKCDQIGAWRPVLVLRPAVGDSYFRIELDQLLCEDHRAESAKNGYQVAEATFEKIEDIYQTIMDRCVELEFIRIV
jgi:hypothetical protein